MKLKTEDLSLATNITFDLINYGGEAKEDDYTGSLNLLHKKCNIIYVTFVMNIFQNSNATV